jgi:hypothetical protein
LRIYNASSEEALHARKFLKDWAGEGFLSAAQYERMQQETVCNLRLTNIFLRLVLFLFTLIIVGSAAGLFFAVFLARPWEQRGGVLLVIFAVSSYMAAEIAATRKHLYRYGIEEALAVCAVGFLCVGLGMNRAESVVPAAGAIASLWIWRRFGLAYAFPAAMIFSIFLPTHWTSSHSAQHVIVALFYAIALASVVAVRSRHGFDYLNDGYSLVEAFLWLGIYLAMNLQLSSLNLLGHWWGNPLVSTEFSGPFYWATWVLIWCLPPVVLVRGVRRKDRFVIAVGALLFILTLITNKPYLGWQRHTWDPILLGTLLIGTAIYIRRWLTSWPGGIRHGFTAERLSGRDKRWMNAGSVVFGVLSPQAITAHAQAGSPAVRFGGGDSAGGGASSDF